MTSPDRETLAKIHAVAYEAMDATTLTEMYAALDEIATMSKQPVIEYVIHPSRWQDESDEVREVIGTNGAMICSLWNRLDGLGWRYYFVTGWSTDYFATPQEAVSACLAQSGFAGREKELS